MKLLSIVVPCYNSENYMRHCVDTLLLGGEDVEILIVNDGSADGTAAIADEYAQKYPTIVKAIHKENGGHGSGVNAGIAAARGLYFKVVDSDDWVDEDSYIAILCFLNNIVREGEDLDLLLSNYVYEKEGARRKYVMKIKGLPRNRFLTWKEVRRIRKYHYILMHSVIYRTQLLRDCGLKLPEHTFYVDNIYVFEPLPFVKRMYYLDVDFYRYFIGRDDQSVNEKVMIRRIDQQLRVNRRMADYYTQTEIPDKACRNYMFNYLEMITTISSTLLNVEGSEKSVAMKEELWQYLKDLDLETYQKLRRRFLGWGCNLPGKVGRGFEVTLYHIVQKFVGFN